MRKLWIIGVIMLSVPVIVQLMFKSNGKIKHQASTQSPKYTKGTEIQESERRNTSGTTPSTALDGHKNIKVGQCANLQRSNTYYEITQDLIATDDCLTLIDVQDVTINCHGHTIYSATPLNKNAFYIKSSRRIQIKNCHIRNLNGIVVNNSSNINVLGQKITDFFDFGIKFTDVNKSKIADVLIKKKIPNHIQKHGHNIGILLLKAVDVSVTNTESTGNMSVSVAVVESKHCSLENSNLNHTEIGFLAMRSGDVSVTNTRIRNNKIGINLDNVDTALTSDTIIESNTESGIYVGKSSNVVFKKNRIDHNRCGVLVNNSDHIEILHNTITNNNLHNPWHAKCMGGIDFQYVTRSKIMHNKVIKNYPSNIWVQNGNSNKILYNTIKDAEGKGFSGLQMHSSTYNEIGYNIVASNRIAIYLMNKSTHNKIHHNYVYHNYEDGIDFDKSEYNDVYNNVVKDTKVEGICFWSAGNNLIYNNVFNNKSNQWFDHDPGSILYKNTWNVSRTDFVGGNYWANPKGSGFSETCPDKNKDGICDSKRVLDWRGLNVDYMPLSQTPKWVQKVINLKDYTSCSNSIVSL